MDGNPPSEILDIFLKWWLSRLQRSIQKEVGLQQEYLKPEPREAVRLEGLLRALDKLGLLSINVDNKTLTKASRSKDWLVRLGVALHPSSSEGILKILRSDSDSDVARAASMNRSLISSL